MKKYIVGLDIGGTKCAVVLANCENGISLLDRITFPTNAEAGYPQAQDRLFEGIRDILDRNGLKTADLAGLGASCGGPLDSRHGIVLSPPNLPGWDHIPFAKLLEETFQVPSFLQNDANACALAEWKMGAGRGTDDMVFLTMGTGFGAGIIAEGKLIRGISDMGGEVGHVRLEADGPVGFGKAGSMEGFCSGGGIARQARMLTEAWVLEGRTPMWVTDGVAPESLNVKVLAEYAERGDPDAMEVFSIVGDHLGAAVSVLIDILNPARIVIGSIFVRCGHLLRPAMSLAIEREALVHARIACDVVPAALGEQLGDYASVLVACHGLGLETEPRPEPKPAVMRHLDRLMERYPDLVPIRNDVKQAFDMLTLSFRSGGKLLVCGNGGSAADADHIVGELMKGFYKQRPLHADIASIIGDKSRKLQGALPAIALTHHNALSTAFANDVDPCTVFAQQVLGYGTKADIFLGMSTSGNSPNVVFAAETARAIGMRTLALTGPTGGRLDSLCDVTMKAPGACTADIQERHLPIYHALCAMLEEEFF
jgi:glucokinase